MSEILFSSSYDEKNPPENILSPSKDKFFSSTGMFPQEICIQFDSVKTVNSVGISSYGIKKLSVQTCENDSVVSKMVYLDDCVRIVRGQDVSVFSPFDGGIYVPAYGKLDELTIIIVVLI